MLNDENRQGTGQTDGFGGGFNANIVGSGASLISFMPPKPGDDPIPPVPVPASLPLLLAGLGGLTLLRKRRKT
jgi:hypothetical protein